MMSKYECYYRFFRPSNGGHYRFLCPGCITGNCPLHRHNVCLILQGISEGRPLLTWNDVKMFVEGAYANS